MKKTFKRLAAAASITLAAATSSHAGYFTGIANTVPVDSQAQNTSITLTNGQNAWATNGIYPASITSGATITNDVIFDATGYKEICITVTGQGTIAGTSNMVVQVNSIGVPKGSVLITNSAVTGSAVLVSPPMNNFDTITLAMNGTTGLATTNVVYTASTTPKCVGGTRYFIIHSITYGAAGDPNVNALTNYFVSINGK